MIEKAVTLGTMTDTNPTQEVTALTDAQRADILSREVAKYVRSGWATETVSTTQAVLIKTKRIGWFWNIILVVITGGLWLIYIIYRALNRKSKRLVLFVNELGQVEKR
jgi:hypothetical protein